MGINREYIISKIKRAIEELPSNGLILREVTNKFHEKEGYKKIADTRGLLYSEENNKTITISLQDKGQLLSTTSKKYLIPYDENSQNAQKTDLIFVEDKVYKINDLGENLKMYFLMQLEEVEGLRLLDNKIIENGSTYDILEG